MIINEDTLGPSMVGKTTTIKSILKFKSTLFVKPYERWIYVSPNLQSMHLPHEQKLKEVIKCGFEE